MLGYVFIQLSHLIVALDLCADEVTMFLGLQNDVPIQWIKTIASDLIQVLAANVTPLQLPLEYHIVCLALIGLLTDWLMLAFAQRLGLFKLCEGVLWFLVARL